MPALIIFVSTLVLLWAVSRRMAVADHPRPSRETSRRAASPRSTPRPLASFPMPEPAATVEPSSDAMRSRLRDRYIAARFPGIASSAANFADAGEVVTTARLLFEEGRYEDAQEFLQLAIGLSSASEPLRLAQIEIAFLHRDTTRFYALAREFRTAFPASEAWTEIVRLGHGLAPDDPLFAAWGGERRHEHYGAWPDTPNWIAAPWDLTHDMLAAEFHRAMKDEKGAQA